MHENLGPNPAELRFSNHIDDAARFAASAYDELAIIYDTTLEEFKEISSSHEGARIRFTPGDGRAASIWRQEIPAPTQPKKNTVAKGGLQRFLSWIRNRETELPLQPSVVYGLAMKTAPSTFVVLKAIRHEEATNLTGQQWSGETNDMTATDLDASLIKGYVETAFNIIKSGIPLIPPETLEMLDAGRGKS